MRALLLFTLFLWSAFDIPTQSWAHILSKVSYNTILIIFYKIHFLYVFYLFMLIRVVLKIEKGVDQTSTL